MATHDEYTAFYILGIKRKLDWAYSNFGAACTDCGPDYGSASLSYGSVRGGYEGMPRADGGDGFDHRQLLVDGTGDTCVAAVCAADDAWNSACVSRAASLCP